MPRPGGARQPLGVVPMALALLAAAFLGGGLGLLIEGGGDDDQATKAPATDQQVSN